MPDDYKLCPQCEEEYTLSATTCAECGVPLVSAGALSDAHESDSFPDVDELECVRVAPLPWIRALSEALSAAEIEHRIEHDTRSVAEGGVDPRRFGDEPLFGAWVRDGDIASARDVDRRLFAHLEPDAEEVSEGDDACPACQEALPPHALECPGCGLTFG